MRRGDPGAVVVTTTGGRVDDPGSKKLQRAHLNRACLRQDSSEQLANVRSSSAFWTPVFSASPELAKRDIYVYDQDGHGLSPFSGRSDGIAAYVADLKSVLGALGLQKAVLVAHSMNAVSMLATRLSSIVVPSYER